jgi:hypothetical protein
LLFFVRRFYKAWIKAENAMSKKSENLIGLFYAYLQLLKELFRKLYY